MDYRDQDGFLVDSTYDGGDSTHFAGLSMLFGGNEKQYFYETNASGVLVRHPPSQPWDNPKNVTIDQIAPFVAGCSVSRFYKLPRRVFWASLRRGFFAQNFERDWPGSTKYPWPHSFHKDSDPNKELEFKWFDFADPMGPADIWHLILCARLYPLYWFGLIGYPALFLTVLLHCKFNKSDDEGQIIAKVVIGGKFFVRMYKKLKPDWKLALWRFWSRDRLMPKMFQHIVNGMEGI